MESSSVAYPCERKLKQATLLFEIVKAPQKNNEPACKKPRLDGDNLVSVEDDDSVQFEAIVCKTETGKEEQSKCSFSITEENICESSDVISVKDSILVQSTDCVNQCGNTSQIVSSSVDVVLIDSENLEGNKNNVKNHAEKLSFKSTNAAESDVTNGKRKLENDQEKKDQKPRKRVKLIYHVDKLQNRSGGSGELCRTEMCVTEKGISVNNGNVSQMESIANVACEVNSNLLEPKSQADGSEHDIEKTLSVNCINLEKNQFYENKTITPESGLERTVEKHVDLKISKSCETEIVTSIGDATTNKTETVVHVNCLSGEKKLVKRLTPKLVQQKHDLKKREEKEREKLEKVRLKKERKEEKVRIKQEREEEKVRIKQEKEEVKKKLKEEREKKRLAELELRNEEKRKKEEDRRKKEEQKLEEKRKKEEQKLEEKRKKEELQRKKEEEEELLKKKFTKEAAAFSNFFKKCDLKSTTREEDTSQNEIVFMPFTVKADMRLAPVNRNAMDNERRLKFEEYYTAQSVVETYLKGLLSGTFAPKKSGNTWPLEEKYDDVLVLDECLDIKNESTTVAPKRYTDRRPKLLQFHENRRPPYWGTWRKKSKSIRAKNPFGKDEIFDYEVDSDDEWEEEEPGESLHGSDDEKESEDEYEVDNDFFVPHGYLSDDENPEDELISPEAQKIKLKLLGDQFDSERNEKTKLLKPITLGCIWFNSDNDEPCSANSAVVKFLNKRKAVPWTDSVPISLVHDENTDPNEANLSEGGTPTSHKKATFPESAIPDLITLIYGSTSSRKTLSKLFLSNWFKKDEKVSDSEVNAPILSQARVAQKIKELGKWEEFPEEGPFYGKWCWYVKKDVREKYGLGDLPVPARIDDASAGFDPKDSEFSKKISPPLITKFTKVLTEDERRNQLASVNTFRKLSVSTPKSPPEIPTSDSKSPMTSLKCVKKLQDFYAKPSINAKYSLGVSVSEEKSAEETASIELPLDNDNRPDSESSMNAS